MEDVLVVIKKFYKTHKEIGFKKEKKMQRVILESPYAGEVKFNEIYGELCMHDCLVNHDETPYASHLLYTRKYVLDDTKPEERKLGINAGFDWREATDKSVFYIDVGFTDGMKLGMENCVETLKPFETRRLPDDIWNKFGIICAEENLLSHFVKWDRERIGE